MSTSSTQVQAPSARSLVLAKGFFDVFLGLSLMFAPSLVYEGAIFHQVAKMTGGRLSAPLPSGLLPSPHFTFASLILGAGVSAIRAGQSDSPAAHQSVACLNATFALCLILGTLISPTVLGSSFTVFAALQDVAWSMAMRSAGGWTMGEMMGWAGVGDKLEETRPRGREVLDKAKEGGMEKLDQAKDKMEQVNQAGRDGAEQVRASAGKALGDIPGDIKQKI